MKNLKNINDFINESHEDIDPYGEEDWNEYEYFKKGDKVICIDFEQRHLPDECFKFLKDKQDNIFEVLMTARARSGTVKIHIGCVTKNNLPFLFSQKRFKKI